MGSMECRNGSMYFQRGELKCANDTSGTTTKGSSDNATNERVAVITVAFFAFNSQTTSSLDPEICHDSLSCRAPLPLHVVLYRTA